MDREDGYYWVKYSGKWRIAEYNSKRWWLAGIPFPLNKFTVSDWIIEERLKEPE